MFVILIVILIFPSLCYAYVKNSFNYWKRKGVPCDEPIIPHGNTKELGKTIHPAEFTKNLYDKYKSTGAKLCGAYFSIRPWAILLDLEVVRKVLVDDFNYFNDRGSCF